VLADIVSASPLTTQILAIAAAAFFFLAAVAQLTSIFAVLERVGHPALVGGGLCLLALAVLFLT
jgi:hypothetical protein